MERKSWRLWIVVALMSVLVLLVCSNALAGEGNGPKNPKRQLVRELDDTTDALYRRRGYMVTGITFTEVQTPSLSQTGIWQINMDPQILGSATITKRNVYIQSIDPNGGYSGEYFYDNPGDTIESCPFVAPGTYRLCVYYNLSNGGQYAGIKEIVIAEDGVHPTVQQKVAQILQECKVEGDDWQTALNLHDWLTHHAYYDLTYSYYGAVDVLLRGYGVCDSYTKAYQFLLNAAGITNDRAESKEHAWNMIQMGGEWYHVDVTWDDPTSNPMICEAVSGNECYDFFCINDELIYGFLDDTVGTHKERANKTGICTTLTESYPLHTQEWKDYGKYWVDSSNNGDYSDLFLATALENNEITTTTFTVQANAKYLIELIQLENSYSVRTYEATQDNVRLMRYYYAYGLSMAGIETENGDVLDVSVQYNLDDLFFTVNVIGWKEEYADVSSELVENDGKWNLLISGDGKMPDYAAVADVPWSADVAGKTIDRVVLSEGLTHIGSNAFAMLNDGVRIDFLQTAKPTVAEDAFGNIQAVCRYYSTDSSWSSTTSATNVTWIDLPASMANNDAPLELRYRVNSATSAGEWAIGPRTNSYNNNTVIRADQAKEITYNDRWVVFEAIPTTSVTTAATDKAVYEGLDAPTVLLFMEGTNGTYTIDFTGKPANLRWVESRSRNPLNLTITAPVGNQLEEMVICDGGQITYTGNVDQVTLKTTQWQTPEITINGDVSELTYYDTASDSPFKGTLTVNGTIAHGTMHSQTGLFVPGISATNEPVEFRNIAAYTIENIQQTTPVITLIEVTGEDEETHQESRLSIGNETVQPTVLSLDKFRISYTFLPDRIAFNLDPKSDAGLGNYSAYIYDIRAADYNPGFTTADIIQGPDTVVYVHDTGTGDNDQTTEFGNTNTGSTQVGIRTMYLQNCKVKVNWPVDQIMIWQQSYKDGPVILEINSQVNSMGMFLNQGGGLISIGSNGSLKGGYVNRGIRGNRYFGAVKAGGIVAENGTLCQMSWKQGETTKALLASDAIVTAAAGNQVASGQFASMDVADATLAQLSTDEQRALNDYLTDQELDADHVISVFDVSVNTYERDATNDNLTQKETLSELTNPVSITIANNAGETAKVVRLHEGTSGSIQADELENQSEAEGVYEFSTKWFSKYALVAEEIPLTEEELTTGKSQLTWYTGLKSGWYDEPGLYDMGGIGYFGIPYSEQIAENTPVWTLTLLNGTDCFELYGYNDDQRTRELRPKTENLTSGTSSQYEVSCQVGNTIYRATTTITIAQAEGIPTGIQLQKASFNPETAAIGSTWTDVGNETDLVSGGAIAIRALYIGNGLGDIKDQVLDCMYYGGENSFIDTPYRWNYKDADGKILIDNNVQPILAVSTGMSTVEFGIMISGTNLQYYAKTDIYVNRDQLKSFTAPVITLENGKTQYYEGEAFTISCPWITGAESIDMIIWETNGNTMTAYAVWDQEVATCTFMTNNVDPNEDRRLTAGQYRVQVIPRAAGYIPASYSKDFEIISLPDFTTFEIPEETAEIGAEAFSEIAAKNVRIPDECTTIGTSAFANSQMENIFIPASVTNIGDNAFPTGTTVFMTQENNIAAGLRTKQYTVIIIPAGIDAGE